MKAFADKDIFGQRADRDRVIARAIKLLTELADNCASHEIDCVHFHRDVEPGSCTCEFGKVLAEMERVK